MTKGGWWEDEQKKGRVSRLSGRSAKSNRVRGGLWQQLAKGGQNQSRRKSRRERGC